MRNNFSDACEENGKNYNYRRRRRSMGGGSNRNLRVAEWAYLFIKAEGPQTVSEIKDYINNRRHNYEGTHRARKGLKSVTSQQLTQLLRCSPLFKGAGMTTIRYTNWSRLPKGFGSHTNSKTATTKCEVQVYDIVPVKEIVDKMEGKIHTTRVRWPKPLKDELKLRGMI